MHRHIDWRYRECGLWLLATEHSARLVPDSATAYTVYRPTSSIVNCWYVLLSLRLFLHISLIHLPFFCGMKFLLKPLYGYITETSCDDGLIHDSRCYKVHSEERVRWFTAVNRCLSYNATLAVFDDNILTYFTVALLRHKGPLWIGLVRPWWTWPDAG